MPAHRPTDIRKQSSGILSAVQRKPAWLLPLIFLPLVILTLFVVVITVPRKNKTVRNVVNPSPATWTTPVPAYSLSTDPTALVYQNDQYGFKLHFPAGWKGKYQVQEQPDGIQVFYLGDPRNPALLLTIVALPETEWRNSTGKPYLLSSRKGIVFGYVTPATGVTPFGTDQAVLATEYTQLETDVPTIAQTFEFLQ